MFCSRSIGRGGVTLVEMMIAMIITLMIVFAMVQAFARIGETTTDGRAVIEMLGQMRQARIIVEEDIGRCTIPPAMRDPRNLLPDQYHGYIEIIEGTGNDTTPGRYLVRTPNGLLYNTFDFSNPVAAEAQTLFGDLDDILCMTMRNDEVPFRGRMAYPGFTTVIESNLAEVIWWAELNDQPQDVDGDGIITPPQDTNGDGFIDVAGEGGYGEWNPGETFTIRRRVLLIRPDLAIPDPSMSFRDFWRGSDLSVHFHSDATTHAPMGLRANSLGDLTYRWNRVAHLPIDFSLTDVGGNPLGLSTGLFLGAINPTQLPAYTAASMRGEDVVLSNVTAFDLRVWDPNVPVFGYPTLNGELPEGLVPLDPGYAAAAPLTAPANRQYGAFVDLGAVDPTLSPANLALFNAILRSNNGYDDNGNGVPDPDPTESSLDPQFVGAMQARAYLPAGNYVYDPWTLRYESDTFNQDGLLDSNAIVDEGGETAPPYPHPLKVLQVRIRMYESDTRQVKQVSQNIEFAK